ncbi:MAG: zinc-dependent metalloprotease [Xanthomonadaceae bacterium]|nr:zinc-dependent metalloprotease [Xanthomonadaceae bacterium]
MFKKLRLVSLIFAVGCSSQNGFDSKLDVKAPALISSSFRIQATEPSPISLDKAKIVINKSSLDKEFLLQASLILQADVALGSGLKSRIVAFKQRGEKLYMMEATQGHTLSTDTPQNFILAEFPITAQSDETITFDFNAGMKDVYLMGDWGASDFSGNVYDAVGSFYSISAKNAFIEKAELNANNQLVISQISQLPITEQGFAMNYPTEVRYYLSPYQVNPDYVAMKSGNFDRVGFFEVAPQHTLNGKDVTYVSKWDISKKPIVYAVSANTPAEYKQAVKDGALYWNKVFGSDVIQVVDGAQGVTAPDINANVIQWVNWDDAGFAYADAQMDPRNGEIQHAQVYFTSAFAFHGKDSARGLLRLLNAPATRHDVIGDEMDEEEITLPSSINSKKDIVALRKLVSGQSKMDQRMSKVNQLRGLKIANMTQTGMCNRHFTHELAQSLENMLAEDPTDAQVAKASQDYVREVVAHEIGHTLGLRHNFAGNLVANYSLSSRKALAKEYLSTGNAPAGVVTTSSVMEYQAFEEAAMTGDQIGKGTAAYSYDVAAINTLYKNKKYAYNETPVFCTDSHSGVFSDCNVFDYGSSYIEYSKSAVEDQIAALPSRVFERFVAAKTPTGGADATVIEFVRLPRADRMAVNIIIERFLSYLQFTPEGGLLKVRRQFPNSSSIFAEKIRKAELDYVDGELTRLGGADRVYAEIGLDVAAKAQQQFMLLASLYQDGKGNAGQAYSFTADELDVMAQMSEAYFKQVQKFLLFFDNGIMNGAFDGLPLADHVATEKLGQNFKTRMRKVLFASDPLDIIFANIDVPSKENPTITNVVTAKLPKFKYELAHRMMTATYLRAGRSPSIDKLVDDKKAIQKDLRDNLSAALGTSIDTIDVTKLSKDAAKWVNEARAVLLSIQ